MERRNIVLSGIGLVLFAGGIVLAFVLIGSPYAGIGAIPLSVVGIFVVAMAIDRERAGRRGRWAGVERDAEFDDGDTAE